MASTIAPIRAINYAAEYIQQLPVTRDAIRVRIMDDAAKLIWQAQPWRWTVGALTPTALTNDVDEITITGFPSDFQKILWAGLMTPDNVQDLVVVPNLPDDSTYKGQPKRIAPVSGSTVRIYPIPAGYSSPLPLLVGTYKKKHTEITAANESTASTLVMDDEWYFVYNAWVLYFAMVYAEDPRAQQQFQLASFFLTMMREVENPGINFYGEEVKG